MERYDAIIVGGGLGGLTAGAKLAKEGKKVLLIEQHNIPGGCATTFKRKDYIMEVGLHEMDGLDERDPKKDIFEELGVFDSVDFIKIPEFYRVANEKMDIVIPASTKEATKVLTEKFPEEKKGIKKFFKTIHAIQKESQGISIEFHSHCNVGMAPACYVEAIKAGINHKSQLVPSAKKCMSLCFLSLVFKFCDVV